MYICKRVSIICCEKLRVGVTTEGRGSPAEQHSSGSAGRWVSSQSGAEALLAVLARTHVIAAEPMERSRVDQEVTGTESVWHDGWTGLLCKTHYSRTEGMFSFLTQLWLSWAHGRLDAFGLFAKPAGRLTVMKEIFDGPHYNHFQIFIIYVVLIWHFNLGEMNYSKSQSMAVENAQHNLCVNFVLLWNISWRINT